MNELNGYDIEDLYIGMTASYVKTLTDTDIVQFADVSGDSNAVHIDEEYAATTPFKGRVAHGFLTASLISAAVANNLPGPGSIYMSQSMRFKAPVRPGDTVKVEVKVKELLLEKCRVVMETHCYVGDTQVIDGEAMVMTTSILAREKQASA